ncbi:MAG: YegS/Rv2252/BmrU family lipid kinase [Actinomycetota bacterium]|nr:YegS/Rv2252/BmrU family lipid kinase [Actinomycetota bacterium]
MRSLIVSNAASGGSKRVELGSISEVFAEHGEVTHLAPPSLASFDEDVRRMADGKDLVVVAGGDGTLNCAVNALHDLFDDVALAIVPLGTGNDFARTLELPDDPVAAARAVADGEEAQFDLGRASTESVERFFVNACMGGFPVAVNKAIDEDSKKRLGPLAFWVGGVKAALDLPSFDVDIDGDRIDECVAVGIGNGRTAGGGIAVFPEAQPNDGLLECSAMQVTSVREGLGLVTKMRTGDHVPLDNVHTKRARRIEVVAEPSLEFNVDGDLFDLKTPITFEIAGTLRIRVPRRPTK